MFFHLYPAENGDWDRSSEEDLKNPKTSRTISSCQNI